MIGAYKAGIPANGQPFPDGAKMAKIHWSAKKIRRSLGSRLCQVPNMMLILW